MKTFFKTLPMIATLVAMLSAGGCATPAGHQAAFSDKTALAGNSRQLEFSVHQTLKATKQVLVRQGFTIDSVDAASGLIKATRNLQDREVPEQSYNITASAYAFENGPQATSITLSASQQTILHREWKTWWHLLWIIPLIPTGTEYQTIVTQEGNITDPKFYNDFFTAVTFAGTEIKAVENAAAEKAAAERLFAERAAMKKAAEEKAAAEKVTAEKAAAEKLAAEQASAKKAAEEKAAAEKVAADKAIAEKAAVVQVAVELVNAEKAEEGGRRQIQREAAVALLQ